MTVDYEHTYKVCEAFFVLKVLYLATVQHFEVLSNFEVV